MGYDDSGEPQVDFVWGNMAMQPNWNREGWVVQPGNGEAEFFALGHATKQDWGWPAYYPADYMFPAQLLKAEDSHEIALNQWSGYPDFAANEGRFINGNPDLVGLPNIIGLTKDQALAALKAVGIPVEYLKDFTFTGNESPYDWSGSATPNNDGVVLYEYHAPTDVIGYHWDGTPWLASEAEGLVRYTWNWPGDYGDITDLGVNDNQGVWPWAFSVVNTTDPSKNTWDW